MKSIILLVVFIITIQIIRTTGYKRLLYTITGLLLLNGKIMVISPTFPISKWLIFSLFISIIIRFKYFKKELVSFPILKPFLITFIILFIIGIFDSNLSTFQRFYLPFTIILQSFFLVILGYISTKNIIDLNRILKSLFYILIIIFIYGLFNYITQTNPYYEVIVNLFENKMNLEQKLSYLNIDDNRYRVASTMDMTFNYGYVSALFTVLALYGFKKIFVSKKILYLLLIAGFGGVFLSASRAVLITVVFGTFFYLLYSYNSTKKFKIFFLFSILFIISYSLIPIVQNRFNAFYDLFATGGSEVSGSSIEMRILQLSSSFDLFLKSPIIGNGYYFIQNGLGFGTENYTGNADLAGFESYLFVLLIEQGLLGIIANIIFFISIFHYFKKYKSINNKITILGSTIVISFLTFALATGVLGAWPVSMLLIGIIIKSIELEKKYYESN